MKKQELDVTDPVTAPAFERQTLFRLTELRIYNSIDACYMDTDSTTSFVGALLGLIDDFVSEFRSRMIATQLIRSVAATAAQYRSAERIRRSTRITAKMCLVLDEADHSRAWLERVERNRLTRRLEPVRQALLVADEIIEKTFSSPGNFTRKSRATNNFPFPIVAPLSCRSQTTGNRVDA